MEKATSGTGFQRMLRNPILAILSVRPLLDIKVKMTVGYVSLILKRRILVRDMNLSHQHRIDMYNHEII